MELTRQMLAECGDLKDAELVVELGPGTGAFTHHIADMMGDKTDFFALELNSSFVKQLRQDYPELTVYEDSAACIHKYLTRHENKQADVIFSSIPWANLPRRAQEEMFGVLSDAVKPGGYFVSFAYVHAYPFATARNFRKFLRESFETLDISRVVWKNVPPALVYTCRKDPKLLPGRTRRAITSRAVSNTIPSSSSTSTSTTEPASISESS